MKKQLKKVPLQKEELEEGEIPSTPTPQKPLSNEMVKQISRMQTEVNPSSPQILLKTMMNLFYNSNPFIKIGTINQELEVKFGTRGIKHLTRIDYDNVIKKLKSVGFTCPNESGVYYLRVYSEFLDKATGKFKLSQSIRTEVIGLQTIQEFCRVNDIKKLVHSDGFRNSVSFVDKSSVVLGGEKNPNNPNAKVFLRDVVFPDFNFSVSYRQEKTIPFTDPRAASLIQDWTRNKKTFRYLNRVTFQRDDLPVKADIGIVKNSGRDESGEGLKKSYTMTESGIFGNQETYDIELEVDNSRIGPGTEFNTPDKIEEALRKTIKYVLSGLQGTNFPVSISEQKGILRSYMQLIHGKDSPTANKPAFPNDFIGPQSYTLQMQNIVPLDDNTNIPNIRDKYVVTEKADGDRCLLYIADKGKIYLLNTGMNVIFTGAITEDANLYNTLLDGELILHNKHGDFINLFTAFDIYYLDNQDVRPLGFIAVDKEDKKNQYRYPLLKDVVKKLKPTSVIQDEISPIRITTKEFYPLHFTHTNSIFNACSYIQKKIDDSMFEYNTDGLIFTPALFGVGSNKQGQAGPLHKITWDYSFKWKPAEFNTIDFLVTTVKAPSGEDTITPIFEDGINNEHILHLNQYKTLVLNVGFDEKKHGFINPCQDVIEDRLPDPERDLDNEDTYKKQRFYPTKPYDPNAGLCKIMLQVDGNGVLQMKTEEDEVFEDMTIVEFRYDLTREEGWRWVPLRVRYDKTSELKQSLLGIGKPNYGNAYHVADSNWKSIHNPITIKMLTTGTDIPENVADEDVYYNRQMKTTDTKALRDFHNLYVKKKLIMGASRPGQILIDLACGKAGDLPKWISAHLSFVFGIDISKDNLENRLDGACARFLNNRKKFKNMPYALFVNGDSRYNIRDGSAMLNDKAKMITRAVFGEGPKDQRIGEGVLRQYGKGASGFHVTSCQFAIHYFMQDAIILQNFARNVAECTALNGYFIGTGYDGKLVFQMLKNKTKGESVEIVEDGVKIWEIRKQYTQMVLEDDISSVGYQIDVFQESINKMIPEFLVNYDYLNRVMENYGFRLVTREEAQAMGMPEASGLFSELYSYMNQEIKTNRSKRYDYGDAYRMTAYEKKISFLNRYFIYKKIRIVNTSKVNLEDDRGGILAELEEPTLKPLTPVLPVPLPATAPTVSVPLSQTTAPPVKPKAVNKKLPKKLIIIDE